MNDDVRLERLFADGLHELAPPHAPDRLPTTIKAQTGESRPRARWLALIKEPTMRSNNHVAVGSPVYRVAAIMAATLLAALLVIGAGIAGAQILAADGPIVVDQSGDGHFTTIQAAVDAADAGDDIIVKPGTYAEVITIDKDITLRGDGPIEEVVIEHPDAVLLTLQATDAVVADLTLGGGDLTRGMEVYGGAPTISGVVFDHTGRPFDGNACMGTRDLCGGTSLMLVETDARVVESTFDGGGEISIDGGGNVAFEGNLVQGGPQFFIPDAGDNTVFRGNTIRTTIHRALGIFGPTKMRVLDNVFEDIGDDAITIGFENAIGHDPTISGNTFSGALAGLRVRAGASLTLEDNRFLGNGVGVDSSSSAAMIRGNDFEGNDVGLAIIGSPEVTDNTIRDGGTGLRLSGPDTAPVFTDNVVCDNAQDVILTGRAQLPEVDGSNEFCGEPITE